MKSGHEEREIFRNSGLIQPRRRKYLAGMRKEHWKTCAGIHGTGRLRIQKDIRNKVVIHIFMVTEITFLERYICIKSLRIFIQNILKIA